MKRWKVFLLGGDGIGWALDDDLEHTRRALEGRVDFVDVDSSEVVHSVWWEALLDVRPGRLVGKRIICHVSGEPYRYMRCPMFRKALSLVGRWIAQSSQAKSELDVMQVDNVLIPYAVDTGIFHPIAPDTCEVQEIRAKWGIPPDRYIIGNFHRDSEGLDLTRPKLVKGPDIFAEIVRCLWERGHPIHVVLVGPRRFWLRRKLQEYGVPFTYVGKETETDDIHINKMPRESLNIFYNLIDLYLITSRSEGGPRSLLEAAAARCKVLSTPVGLASDILPRTHIYRLVGEAVDLIEADVQGRGVLFSGVTASYERVMGSHTGGIHRGLLTEFYDGIESVLPCNPDSIRDPGASKKRQPLIRKIIRRFRTKVSDREAFTVGLWHSFFEPPYGGGNQFMLALRKALLGHAITVRENVLSEGIDAYVLNSIQFDVRRFLTFAKRHDMRVLHRVDGPIYLVRGRDREKDDLCFDLNARFASATVVQSNWTYERILEMGYRPVNPVIVHNAVDPSFFHRGGRMEFDPNRKIRLISSSWSDNPRKGGPIYKWIEDHLDWGRFEYTFVGRASEQFERIRRLDAVPSKELGDLLRQHDIFVTASENDPCSNAVIEALACGLPVLYRDSGGHPELVGCGGLPFNDRDEILPQLDKLVENYGIHQNLIVVPTLDEVAEKYVAILKDIAGQG